MRNEVFDTVLTTNKSFGRTAHAMLSVGGSAEACGVRVSGVMDTASPRGCDDEFSIHE